MAFGGWVKAFNAVSGLIELSKQFRKPVSAEESLASAARPGGALETRLAGVLVAALREAFDRDSARLELERTHVEAERQRAEQALRAELRRQAADRSLAHLRLIALVGVGAWALSAVLAAWMPGMRTAVPRALLGLGWAAAFSAIGCAFAAWRAVLAASADLSGATAESRAAAIAQWLLLASLAFIAASLLVAL